MKEIFNYLIEEKKLTAPVAKVLMAKYDRNPDIAEEFKNWIVKRNYEYNEPLQINGYTAKKISEIAPQLDAAGVFGFLVTLREKPDAAEETIRRNFPVK